MSFSRKASSAGRLFSSITKEEVAKEISKAAGVKIEGDMLQLTDAGHLKQVGEHPIVVELLPNISQEVVVSIKPE
ncbi:hypothetical protein KW791_04100 [Candidatus Parcubacteria bacterium]|nr:hypothetical protein [Candidatus Parcubacteria bacterium]